jgi:hypothetical protein
MEHMAVSAQAFVFFHHDHSRCSELFAAVQLEVYGRLLIDAARSAKVEYGMRKEIGWENARRKVIHQLFPPRPAISP